MYSMQILKRSLAPSEVMSQKLEAAPASQLGTDEESLGAEAKAQIYALLNRPSPPY